MRYWGNKINNLAIILCLISLSAVAQEDGCQNQFFECSNVYSSLVYDDKTKQIISQKRSNDFIYPASLVKVMTVYLVFEAIQKKTIKLDDVLTFSARGEEISKINKITTLNIKEGDHISVNDAIRGTIIKSFNEAAIVLAEAVAGDEWRFVRLMNKKAKELGMINTSFYNATGLHEQGQYTTSYDLARLINALRKNFPQYYHYFSEKTFSFNDKNFTSHNNVLLEYEGAEGIKTGFTRASGFNLISAATKNDHRLISILANCSTVEGRDQQTKDIFDQKFADLNSQIKSKLTSKIDQNFKYSKISAKAKYFNNLDGNVRIGGGLF